jgi:hypothetical protein
MKPLLTSYWIRYPGYEFRQGSRGDGLYLVPKPFGEPEMYNSMEKIDEIALRAIGIGKMAVDGDDGGVREGLIGFASSYGMLGLMTGLPMDADFTDHENVYFPKNKHVKTGFAESESFVSGFFPFGEPKSGEGWKMDSLIGELLDSEELQTSAGINLVFQRGYGEKYEWLRSQFWQWAKTLSLCGDYRGMDDAARRFHLRAVVGAKRFSLPAFSLEAGESPAVRLGAASLFTLVNAAIHIGISSGSLRCGQP